MHNRYISNYNTFANMCENMFALSLCGIEREMVSCFVLMVESAVKHAGSKSPVDVKLGREVVTVKAVG